VAAHTSYARRKLEQIQERIDKKNQALDALKYSVKPESKVLSILEKEMEWLKSEKRQTEAHLRRTDAWTEHLGKWKATIQSVEVSAPPDWGVSKQKNPLTLTFLFFLRNAGLR